MNFEFTKMCLSGTNRLIIVVSAKKQKLYLTKRIEIQHKKVFRKLDEINLINTRIPNSYWCWICGRLWPTQGTFVYTIEDGRSSRSADKSCMMLSSSFKALINIIRAFFHNFHISRFSLASERSEEVLNRT